MNTTRFPFAPAAVLSLALLLLCACAPQPEKPSEPAPAPSSPQPAPTTPESPRPEKLIGPVFTLTDQANRPLSCVILAKQGSVVLVKRNSDHLQYAIDFDRLSPESRQLLASYPDENTTELRAFVDTRDYAAAKRSVKVEMLSTAGSGECAKAKAFFSSEAIYCDIYDHASIPGKQRKLDWKTESLPAVKIGGQVIAGFSADTYRQALLAEYRKTLSASAAP